jgi:hypothetical protein
MTVAAMRVKRIGSCPQDLDAAGLDACRVKAIRAFSLFIEPFLGSEKILRSSSRTQTTQDQEIPKRGIRRVDIFDRGGLKHTLFGQETFPLQLLSNFKIVPLHTG